MNYLGYRKGVLRLSVASDAHRSWVMDNYLSLIRVAATEACDRSVDVQIEVDSESTESRPVRVPKRVSSQSSLVKPTSSLRRAKPRNGNFGLAFDSFVAGEANEFALAACQRVADNPAVEYNPLFICGEHGVGKTHLLCATANSARVHHRGLSVLYQTAEDFTNDLVESISGKRMAGFRAKYRSRDFLLIDDVQFIQDKTKTQEALFHTFNSLYNSGRQIVISSDRAPDRLSAFSAKLVERFSSGLVVHLAPPEFRLKVRILRRKAEQAGINLSDDVAHYIAENACPSVRQLEAMLTKLKAYCEWKKVPLTLKSTEAALQDSRIVNGQILSPMAIQAKVASYFGLKTTHLLSRDRSRSVVNARQVAMYLCRELLDDSYPAIGKRFSGMCHAAVMHSCNRVKSRMITDATFKQIVELLKSELSKLKRNELVQRQLNMNIR